LNRITIFAATVICAATMHAQSNPLSTETKQLFTNAKSNILKSAEKMPEANYSFKPTPEVRSFGEILGHVADAQFLFCSAVKGEPKGPDSLTVEKTKHTKAELTAALNEAFSYCDSAYNALTDEAATEKIKFFGSDRTKAGTLAFNTAHTFEHYGNLVTYLRIKGLVPPSSESSK
jgi:uncharacterized damage-inducible protein DinB